MRLIVVFITTLLALQAVSQGQAFQHENVAISSFLSTVSKLPASWNLADIDNKCTWTGITCWPDSSIRKIEIVGDNQYPLQKLTGTLPSDLGNLQNLTTLALVNHRLTGELPASLFTIPSLDIVNLSDNKFHGQLPSTFSQAQRLQSFDVTRNFFSGALPDGLATSDELITLALSENHFGCPSSSLIARLQSHLNLPECDFSMNMFASDDFDLCGGVLPPMGRCKMHPAAAIMTPDYSSPDFILRGPNVEVRFHGRVSYFFAIDVKTNTTFYDEFTLLDVQGVAERNDSRLYSVIKSMQIRKFDSYELIRPLAVRATAILLDGSQLYMDVELDHPDAPLKWSAELSNYTFQPSSAPSHQRAFVNAVFAQHLPYNVRAFTCPILFPDKVCLDDGIRPSSFNLSTYNRYGIPGLPTDLLGFTVTSPNLVQYTEIPTVYTKDDDPTLIPFDAFFPEGFFLPYGRSGYIIDSLTGDSTAFAKALTPADAKTTSIAAAFSVTVTPFTKYARYDPTVSFTILLSDESPQDGEVPVDNTVAIAVSVTVAGVALIGVIVVFAHPKIRAKVLPFKQTREHQRATTMEGGLRRTDSSWKLADRRTIALENVANP